MMIFKVKSTIEKYNMLDKGDKVLIALSGGSDSMSLLNSMLQLKDEYDLSIEAAHINHCIRGNDADNDELFVRDTCNKLNIKLHVLKADVIKIADENNMTVEEAGRMVRYDYFKKVCPDGKIATAHNLNDRLETMLFNLSRGTTLNGLCSIPPVRDNIIRPLSDCSKDEILNYCNENNISFVTDKTNDDVKYSRNKIRHNIVSEMKSINPSLEESVLNCLDSLIEDNLFIDKCSSDLVQKSKCVGGYNIAALCDSQLPVIKRAIAKIIKAETSNDISNFEIKETLSALIRYNEQGTGTLIQLSGNRFARTRAGILEFPKLISSAPESKPLDDLITDFGLYFISTDIFTPTEGIKCSQKICKGLSIFYCDFDKISGNMIVRSRIESDKIRLADRKITKSIRKIQNEKQMLPEEREMIPIIADDIGIICAFGCGMDERVAVDKSTVKIIKFEIKGGI